MKKRMWRFKCVNGVVCVVSRGSLVNLRCETEKGVWRGWTEKVVFWGVYTMAGHTFTEKVQRYKGADLSDGQHSTSVLTACQTFFLFCFSGWTCGLFFLICDNSTKRYKGTKVQRCKAHWNDSAYLVNGQRCTSLLTACPSKKNSFLGRLCPF